MVPTTRELVRNRVSGRVRPTQNNYNKKQNKVSVTLERRREGD